MAEAFSIYGRAVKASAFVNNGTPYFIYGAKNMRKTRRNSLGETGAERNCTVCNKSV